MLEKLISYGGIALLLSSGLAAEQSQEAELAQAIQRADMANFQRLLDAGLPVDTLAPYEKLSILELAIQRGQIPMAQELRQRGAKDQDSGADAHVELMACVLRGDPETARRMIEEQSIPIAGSQADNLLKATILKRQYELASFILSQQEKGAFSAAQLEQLFSAALRANADELATAILDYGYEPSEHHAILFLTQASRQGLLKSISALVKAGTDVNGSVERKHSPLHAAISAKQEEAIVLLLELGADPHLKETRDTPTEWAKRQKNERALALLRGEAIPPSEIKKKTHQPQNKDSSAAALLQAADLNQSATLRQYIMWGADIHAIDEDGNNLLHHIAWNRQLPLVKQLVKKGISINHINHQQKSPLLLSTQWSDWEAARYLVEAGADVNHTDKYGNSPIEYASGKGNTELVKLLLSKGATPRAEALYSAVAKENIALIDLLLEAGADPNAPTRFQISPLALAEMKGFGKIVDHLRAGVKD